MPKFTKRINRNKKNRTIKSEAIFNKRGGDNSDNQRKGILDIAANKISDATSAVLDKAGDMSLNALGLERINNNEANTKVNEHLDKIGDAASGVVSDVGNAVNNTSSSVIGNVNNVLSSDTVNTSVEEAAKETAEITGKLAEKFNDAMNQPEVKEKVEEAIEHAADIGEIVVKSSEKPLQEAVKVSVEAGTKALGAASAGIIKVGTDMMAAIPGLGAVIELGKMLNDGSKAASAVVEAGSEAVETASDAFMETTENVKKGLRELEEKKKMAQQISNRTTKSINQFENPLQNTTSLVGGRKTKRRLLKRKAKSKRVRFAS
jgi:ABC-type transporter Mla subunit MlaD